MRLLFAFLVFAAQSAFADSSIFDLVLTGSRVSSFCRSPQSAPRIKTSDSQRQFDFSGFYVAVSPGGTILSKEDIENDRKKMGELEKSLKKKAKGRPNRELVAAVMNSSDRYPNIGLRALYADAMGMGDSLRFTTFDGKFDVEIQNGVYECRIVEFASFIADAYKKQIQP